MSNDCVRDLSFEPGRREGMESIWKIVCVTGLISMAVIGCSGTGTSPDSRPVADLRSVEPRVLDASQASIDIKLPGTSVDAAAGAGSLWVLTRSNRHRPGRIVRVDLKSGRLVSSIAIATPQAVAFGSGSVWVAQFEADRVIRIDPGTGRVLARIHLSLPEPVSETPDGSAFYPFDIAAGGGALWVSTARGSVARIDPKTNRVTGQIPIPQESSADLTVGRGAIWLAGDLDGLRRIDIDTGSHTAIPIESPDGSRLGVTSLAVAGGSVYVTGNWAAVSEAEGYVATDRAAFVELSARRGKVVRSLPLRAAMGVTPGREGSAWLSPWVSRRIYSVRPGTAGVGPVVRLSGPGHLLAAVHNELWIEGSNRRLARYPVGNPR